MVRLAEAVLFLFVPFALPSIALFGRSVLALVTSSLLTAISASISGMVAVALGSQLLPWFLIFVGSSNVIAIVRLWRRKVAADRRHELIQLAMLALIALPLLGLRRTVVDWDARSIWLFHARWFFAGGKYVRNAFVNPAFAFSNVDYPPLASATVGTIWSLGQMIDPRLGQIVIGFLTFSATAVLAIALVSLAPPRLSIQASVIGAILGIGTFGVAGWVGTNGYVDLLWTASAVGATVFLLVASANRRNLTAGTLCALVAGMTKNEGLVLAVFILLLAGIRHRHQSRSGLAFGLATLSLMAWPALSRITGANSALVTTALSAPTIERVLSRIPGAFEGIWSEMGPLAIAAICCLALGGFSLRSTRIQLDLGHPAWLWCVLLVSFMSLLLAYGFSPFELGWHLATSVDRTTIQMRVLLLSEISVWCFCSYFWLTLPTNGGGGGLRDRAIESEVTDEPVAFQPEPPER